MATRLISGGEVEGDPKQPRVQPGTLYLCATPIGNLEDVTLRVLRILQQVDLIAAEDTRRTRKLLARYDIHTPLTSCHAHTEPRKMEMIADRAAAGGTVAYASESGTPGISDPGSRLVQACLARGARVEMAPGPTALIPALVLSGLPARTFTFAGFPPRKSGRRRAYLDSLRDLRHTVVLYESAKR